MQYIVVYGRALIKGEEGGGAHDYLYVKEVVTVISY